MEAQPAPGVSPVLDIGGDVGALVVYLASPPPGGELEGCPAGDAGRPFHTGVHLRHVGPSPVHVAVFPALGEGSYDLLDGRGGVLARVVVTGGAVSEVDLRP